MRRLIAFDCAGETLLGTLDEADGATGLLIVSGGNEVRSGAHRGMAKLAGRLAARGYPVLRFDRRGVGDSSGTNGGYASSAPDLYAAVTHFHVRVPGLKRLVALGNCDAATALTTFGKAAGIDALILTNPWTVDAPPDQLPPPSAIRARYLARLRDPASWRRLPKLQNLVKGLRGMLRTTPHAQPVEFGLPATVILADADRTAQTYKALNRGDFVTIATGSHSFADAPDNLEAAIVAALERYSAA